MIVAAAVAGCLDNGNLEEDEGLADEAESIDYTVPKPDDALGLIETQHLLETRDNLVEIHVRVVRPDVEEPVGVIAEFTPYQALSPRNPMLEPIVGAPEGTFVDQFVKRGFAFAYADVRGTGDSSGCIDLRGSVDIQDAYELTEWLGTQEWSNGKVGFIGASYPGSTSHIAGIANNEHLGGIVPVVASTSFYNYHHMGGVPYTNHLTTNNAYNGIAVAPTVNPQSTNYAVKYAQQAECDQDHLVVQTDQSGEYTAWWHDRNLQWRVDEVEVPVLMAQGLQDWNVKPNHIATYFNELSANKTLVAPQMGHGYPGEGAYGQWWEFAAAFFDETLNGVRTGMFDGDRAYVQNSDEDWTVYEDSWPPVDATWRALNLTASGMTFTGEPSGSFSWEANPAGAVQSDDSFEVVLESEALPETLYMSGAPKLNMTITSSAENVHITAVLQYQEPGGSGWNQVTYGYLNPIYREGLDDPRPVLPGIPVPVTVEFHPQEDVYHEDGKLRLIISSTTRTGSTVPVFDIATIDVDLEAEERPGQFWLPISPPGGMESEMDG